MRFCHFFLPCLLLAPSMAQAEVFDLRNGGRIAGEIINRHELPRRKYMIRLTSGDLITLDRDQVEQVVRLRPEEIEHDRIKARYPDTADAQWQLAEWCREKNLPRLRLRHLERVIELEPDHLQARAALGYIRPDGDWKPRTELMAERGYVRRGGRWLLPQELELDARARQLELARKEWLTKLRRWRRRLEGAQAQAAKEEFLRLADPAAAAPLRTLLLSEKTADYRRLYIDALERIGSADAWQTLLDQSLADEDAGLRHRCLEAVMVEPKSLAVRYYIAKLNSRDNAHVNRAAAALRELNDPIAVGPLIAALITKHYVADPDDASQELVDTFVGLSASLAGLEHESDTDDAPVLVRRELENPEVRRALVALGDGAADFQFDRRAWKAWWKARRWPSPTTVTSPLRQPRGR
jgi:hypothetical protein